VRQTPFTSRVKKIGKATNVLFEWLADNYADPKVSGSIDGKDISEFENAVANRARLKNRLQIFDRTAKVSTLSQEVSDVAGLGSGGEIVEATRKSIVELKRDIEATFLGGADAQEDDGSKPNLTCAMDTWISTAGPTLYSVNSNFRTPSTQVNTTATASLTEDTDIQGMLTAIYDSNGFSGEHVLLCGSVLRRRFTDMSRTVANTTSTATKVRSFTFDGEAKTVSSSTSIYNGDYGSMEVVSSNFIGGATTDTDRGYVLDFTKLAMHFNRMPTMERLPDEGGGPRVLIRAIAGLRVDNPRCFGKFKP
jgi:hypothetical protein